MSNNWFCNYENQSFLWHHRIFLTAILKSTYCLAITFWRVTTCSFPGNWVVGVVPPWCGTTMRYTIENVECFGETGVLYSHTRPPRFSPQKWVSVRVRKWSVKWCKVQKPPLDSWSMIDSQSKSSSSHLTPNRVFQTCRYMFSQLFLTPKIAWIMLETNPDSHRPVPKRGMRDILDLPSLSTQLILPPRMDYWSNSKQCFEMFNIILGLAQCFADDVIT